MIIKVTDTQTANQLNNSMSSGNCIVLYHMHGCPYCVQMMPDWTNFMQLASKQLPGLTIGEVERTHMDKLGDTGVSSFPTIKFYKAGNTQPAAQQQQPMHAPKQNNFRDILKGIMGQMSATSTNNMADNSVMFEDTRTTDKLIKFAKDNLAKGLNTKGKKTKKVAINTLTKAKKTKKMVGKKAQELTNSLAKLSANGMQVKNSNMMDLHKYRKAKKTDAKTAKKLKKQILG